jgi:hypothetical protein
VNPIPKPGLAEIRQKEISEKFGAQNFQRASRFADTLDEPKDLFVIQTILEWMNRYPASNLDQAFEQVSRYERNNPRRSLYYLRGILEGMQKESIHGAN